MEQRGLDYGIVLLTRSVIRDVVLLKIDHKKKKYSQGQIGTLRDTKPYLIKSYEQKSGRFQGDCLACCLHVLFIYC